MDTIPGNCNVTVACGIATPLVVFTIVYISNVMLVLLVASTFRPVTIDSRYADWKGGRSITGGTIPLIKKSPLFIDPSTIPNSICSIV